MRASIQEKIAPAKTNNTKKMNTARIDDQTGVVRDRSNDIDFKSVLMESNAEQTRKREMRQNGDLSTADQSPESRDLSDHSSHQPSNLREVSNACL